MKITEEQKIALYLKWRDSIESFARSCFPHLLESKTPGFHSEIYDLLPKERRIVLAAPRGFAKSTIVAVIYVLWLVLFKKAKDICIISASETLAVDLMRKVKHELEKPLVMGLWGNLKSDKWSESHIITNTGINIRAKGAQGQIRGFRPDVIICDDLETDESVESEEQRKKLKDWLFKACLNSLTPDGQFCVIGTVIHPLAVLEDLLTMPNGFTKKRYQAYIDGIEKQGNELWGERFNHEWLQKRKAEIGSFRFFAEFLNKPVSDETAPIKEGQIRYWTELPKQYSCVVAVDPAYSEEETADFKVASVVGIDQGTNRYLETYLRTHAPIGEFQDGIINLWLNRRGFCTAIGIPNQGVEKSFFESFVKRCQERKVSPPIVELKNSFQDAQTQISKRNKKARIIASLQPLFEQGKYYIHSDHFEARDELLTIGSSRWDDITDTMSYAEQILQPVFYEVSGTDENWDDDRTVPANYGLG